MGASIYYRGRLADPGRFQELRHDLLQFADRVKWEFLDLTGPDESIFLEIILYPPGQCEPVFFLFDSEGRLHPAYQVDAGDEASWWCCVKTQYGPVEAHVRILELLRHIQQHYIPDLEVDSSLPIL